MKRILGWFLSYVEGYSFLGFVGAFIMLFFFRVPFSSFQLSFLAHSSYVEIVLAFMYACLWIYPIFLLLSIFFEKTGWLYDGQYKENSIAYDFFFNVKNDMIFPLYAVEMKAYFSASIWLLDALFLCSGFVIIMLR